MDVIPFRCYTHDIFLLNINAILEKITFYFTMSNNLNHKKERQPLNIDFIQDIQKNYKEKPLRMFSLIAVEAHTQILSIYNILFPS